MCSGDSRPARTSPEDIARKSELLEETREFLPIWYTGLLASYTHGNGVGGGWAWAHGTRMILVSGSRHLECWNQTSFQHFPRDLGAGGTSEDTPKLHLPSRGFSEGWAKEWF